MKTLTKYDYSIFLMRIALGFTVAAHGAQKLLGWYGGYGFEGTMTFFIETIGIPYALGFGIILMESVGMIALILGLGSRFLAGAVIAIMMGAISTVHGQHGFFMNWTGAQGGEGFEFHLLVVALALGVVINGAGAISLDAVIFKRVKAHHPNHLQTVEQ